MTWSAASPNGALSVKDNRTQMNTNLVYIEDAMGVDVVGTNAATTRDHFWAVDTNLDGHHRFIKSPAFVDGLGAPADPVVGTSMDGVEYFRKKTAAESPSNEDCNPFFRNATSIMQLLGIRAMVVWNGSGTIVYSHNVASVVVDGSAGYFIGTFTSALPTANYLVLGGAIRNASGSDRSTKELLFEIQGDNTLTGVKSTTRVKFMTRSDGGTAENPLQGWFICFGG